MRLEDEEDINVRQGDSRPQTDSDERQSSHPQPWTSRVFRFGVIVLLTFGVSCSKKVPASLIQRSAVSPYCCDETGYLGDAAEALSICYENYFAKTDLELAVVLIDSLGDKDIRRLAEKIVEAWGIGRHNHGRGVLVLLALKEQTIRMEVTYALEPVLTDAFCSHLINDQIRPFLKQPGFLSLALQGAAIFLSDRLNLEEDEAAREIFTSWERDGLLAVGKALAGGAGNTDDFEFAVGWESKTVLTDEERRAYPAEVDPVKTLSRYQDVLARRITDPHL
ncbi:MAG: TPM domain-containing protein, partial [Vicinamibacteria bacterium]|nr:TPM domain-containing protein [Vicinamibacteria bacterium]